MSKLITRAYNSFEKTDFGTLIKKSKETRLKDEISVYEYLQLCKSLNLQKFFPRVFNTSFDLKTQNYSFEIERFPSKNLGEILLSDDFLKKDWQKIFDILKSFFIEAKQESMPDCKKDCELMFIEKTQKEYKNLVDNFAFFKELSKFDEIFINNVAYLNFERVWKNNQEKINNILFGDIKPAFVHGDLCFSNILYLDFSNNSEVFLKFIDPRGKFGNTYFFGDQYYDLAKLSHSVNVGYEYFIYDNFTVASKNRNNFNLVFSNDNKKEINKIFEAKFEKEYEMKKIKLIEATIFIGMCARHYDNFNRQLAMYLSGVKLLNEVLK